MRLPWRRKADPPPVEYRFGADQYISWVNQAAWQNFGYSPGKVSQTLAGPAEVAPRGFAEAASAGYADNAVIFAVMAVRQLVFSGIRFQWQYVYNGRPSKLFGSKALRLLEVPWPGGTTQDLLNRMIQDADLSGNWYGITDTPLSRLGGDGTEIVRLRPDWVDHLLEPRVIRGAQVGWRRVGIAYWEGGRASGADPATFLPGEFAHFAPYPDPLANWRGMSWLTPVAREIQSDAQMTAHKQKFFEQGATPNLVVSYPQGVSREDAERFSTVFAAKYAGVENAYKTLHVGGGADVTIVGNSMEQISFKAVQGAGETRIAAAGGVPPVIVGLSEGLQGSALNAGNYGASRRRMADATAHPLWANAAGSIAPLVASVAPPGADIGAVRLWYDPRDVPFLREDEKDSAAIAQTRALTIKTHIDSGFDPASAVEAVGAEDEGLLKHTGLVSVQLQTPGAAQGAPTTGGASGQPATATEGTSKP